MKKDKLITIRLTQEMYTKYISQLSNDVTLSEYIRTQLNEKFNTATAHKSNKFQNINLNENYGYTKAICINPINCTVCQRLINKNQSFYILHNTNQALIENCCIYCIDKVN